jgi:formylglycine-generating enzyme required for sulfatase activity
MLLKLTRVLFSLALISFAGSARAQETASQGDISPVALVIGNGAYAEAPIENAVDGARSVADVLRLGGFRVIYLENALRDDIQSGLRTFAQIFERGATGIIYYSGHAVQYQGRNYLVALDTKISGADDVRREAIDLDVFFDPLIVSRTPGSVIILDASRSNPWQQLLPGGLRGLAAPETVKGIPVVCSAAPGKIVSGSPQASGVFAAQLVQAMKMPDLGFDEIISRTRSAVARINGKDQRVWQSEPPPADLVVISAAKPGGAKPADAVELGFWATIKNSGAAADYQAYLSAYPNGQFALIARSKLAQLQPKASEDAAPRDPTARQTAAARPDLTPAPAGAPAAPNPAASAPATTAATIRDCPVCPELVLIPAGSTTMGSTEVFAFESPVHDITISKSFYIGRREVTFDEWDACLSEGGCQYRPGDRGQGRGLRPASDLDWNDAKAYVAWLSRKTGKTYRLPSEAEWEYAARAGTKTAYYWGNAIEKDRANCAGCNINPLKNTVATGTFPPNAFGLIDMAGNAAEWVEDCWEDNYKTAPKDGSAFTKADCRERVLRGGSFNNDQRFVRTAARFKYDFDVRYYTNGFRVVREK